MQAQQKWARKSQVKARYDANDRQITEMQAAGFPKPHYFGPRSPRWSIDELDDFDRKVLAGEVVLSDAAAASNMTHKARAAYMVRAAAGLVGEKRRATAAKKAAEVAA